MTSTLSLKYLFLIEDCEKHEKDLAYSRAFKNMVLVNQKEYDIWWSINSDFSRKKI